MVVLEEKIYFWFLLAIAVVIVIYFLRFLLILVDFGTILGSILGSFGALEALLRPF